MFVASKQLAVLEVKENTSKAGKVYTIIRLSTLGKFKSVFDAYSGVSDLPNIGDVISAEFRFSSFKKEYNGNDFYSISLSLSKWDLLQRTAVKTQPVQKNMMDNAGFTTDDIAF